MNLQIGWHLVSANREQLACFWTGKFWSWQSNGSTEVSAPWNIKPLGFIGNSPLPFELKAGGKYDTQDESGKFGPVVQLQVSWFSEGSASRYLIPFVSSVGSTDFFVTADGECVAIKSRYERYRIVSEHVEPPKPTAIERLEGVFAEFRKAISSGPQATELLAKGEAALADLKAGAT